MIVSLSAAANVYWLARYVVRLQTIFAVNPLASDANAKIYADAFGVEAKNLPEMTAYMLDATQSGSLITTQKNIQDNVQSVRGIVSQQAFEIFNHMWRNHTNLELVKAELPHAVVLMEQMPEDALCFWRLGYAVESLDVALRFEENLETAQQHLLNALQLLPTAWADVKHMITEVLDAPQWGTFYQLTFRIHQSLEEGV